MKYAVILLVAGWAAVSAMAAVPSLVNYQGFLTAPDGTPLDTVVSMTFNLYSASSGGTAMWTETQSACTVRTGVFHALLGSVTALPDSFGGTDRWLGVTVGGNSEMAPRQRIASVPYSYRVGTVDGASGGTISGKMNMGSGNTNTGGYAFVAGRNNRVDGDYSVVCGGGGPTLPDSNSAHGHWSFVGGGSSNSASGSYSTIGGGWLNVASSEGGVIGGGSRNRVDDWNSVVCGGELNAASRQYASVGGGQSNVAEDTWATVCGGEMNAASGVASAVGGGITNMALGGISAIGGGESNITYDWASTVGGGQYNRARGEYSVVSGGGGVSEADSNSATGSQSFVGGGRSNFAGDTCAVVGGGQGNRARGVYSVVAGGGGPSANDSNSATFRCSTVGGGRSNRATNYYAVVAGGSNCTASGQGSAVVGGSVNAASGDMATVSGGFQNKAVGTVAFIGGGQNNHASGISSVIAGGGAGSADSNSVAVGADYSSIGGGRHHSITSTSAFIGGGYDNHITGGDAVIAGGYTNRAAGQYAAIPGGRYNNADGQYSFAAGQYAKAAHAGSFVWSSGGDTTDSWGAYTFTARASGGVRFYTDVSATNIGASLPAGSGTWSSLSDSTMKRRHGRVDSKDILNKVAALPIERWSYRTQDESIHHIGPMAQDFWNLFHLGEDSLGISTIDPDGIALAAIQELAKQNEELRTAVRRYDDELTALRARVQTLEAAEQKTMKEGK